MLDDLELRLNRAAEDATPKAKRAFWDAIGAVQAFDQAIGEHAKLPFVPDAKANLTSYVIEKGLDGAFHYLAKEEAAIRNNPLKRSTELLQRVFGNR